MKRLTSAITIIAAVTLLLLSNIRPALADGIIIINPPPPEVNPYLTVKYHHVTVTIEDQVATTHVDQVFVNESRRQVEGVYVFPLPQGATINDFAMWVDGKRLEGEVLPADQARRIYEDIVRRQRDPALLEYIGRNTFRASIFPIAPGAEKRVEIEYTQILPMDNGLVHYSYPLDTERFSPKPIHDVSINIEIHSREAIKAVYSPSHPVDVERRGEHNATVGYEEEEVLPKSDFELYYTVSQQDIGLNLLSYAQEGEDGFFLMLLAPRVEVEGREIVAKDLLLVLDTSGSMRGAKIEQAKKALNYVLDHLNAEDRFNLVAFSTGVRTFGRGMSDLDARPAAKKWVSGLVAKGGTNINRALEEALAQVEPGRPTILIFLTDGLATEGVVGTEDILRNVKEAAPENVRIFTFGVGDDVNTILLDRLAREHRGASAYVRPGQHIDEEVSAFYAKVSAPVLSDIQVDFGDIHVGDTYPYPLPDLFVGSQIVVVGRYRGGGETTITVRGLVNGREQTFEFPNVRFNTQGGTEFIPRLWATRKIGYLLNQIRLHGESEELVQEIVELAVRYGILTPYTSFLVNQDAQVFSEKGRRSTAEREYRVLATATPAAPSGKVAVDEAERRTQLEKSETATGATGQAVKVVGDKAFLLRDGVWIDTTFDAERMKPIKVGFMSEEYMEMLNTHPEWGAYFAVGERVLVVLAGQAYQVVPEGEGERFAVPTSLPTPTPRSPLPQVATPTPRLPIATAVPHPDAPTCQGAMAGIVLPALAALLFSRRHP